MLDWLVKSHNIFVGVSLNDYMINPYIYENCNDVHKRKCTIIKQEFSPLKYEDCIKYGINEALKLIK